MEVATYAVVAGAVGTIGLAAGSHAAKGCQGEEPERKARRMVPDSGYEESRIAELRDALEGVKTGLESNVELYEKLENQMKELYEEEVQEGKAMAWREEDVQKTEDFDKAEPSAKLQMVESDLGQIKNQATQQEKLIAEFNKRRAEPVEESLRVLGRMEKELLDLKDKSSDTIQAMATTAQEIERLMVMTPKELDGWQEDDGDKPVTKKEALENMDSITKELEMLLKWQQEARSTTQTLYESLEDFKIPKHQPEAGMAGEEALTQGSSASMQVTSLKEQLMAAMIQVDELQKQKAPAPAAVEVAPPAVYSAAPAVYSAAPAVYSAAPAVYSAAPAVYSAAPEPSSQELEKAKADLKTQREKSNAIEAELVRHQQSKAMMIQTEAKQAQELGAKALELKSLKQAKDAIEQEMESHKQNTADQRKLVEELQLQKLNMTLNHERQLQEQASTTSPSVDLQDAQRKAASAEEELAQLKREFYTVQERALQAETSAAQNHSEVLHKNQEVMKLQDELASQQSNGAEVKLLRAEHEQLKSDNTQLHTNQDIYERNQQVLKEDNAQLLANQQQLEGQLQAGLAREEALTQGSSASTEVTSLKEQLMAAMIQLESQQQAHSLSLQTQNQETVAQLEQLSLQLQDADRRADKMGQEKDRTIQQLNDDHASQLRAHSLALQEQNHGTVAQLEQLSLQLQDADRRTDKVAEEKDRAIQQLNDDHVTKSRRLTEEFEKEYVSLNAQNLKERQEKAAAEEKITKLELELTRSKSAVASGRVDALAQERDTLSRQLAVVQGDLHGKMAASDARVQQSEARAKQAEAEKSVLEARLQDAVARAQPAPSALPAEKDKVTKLTQDLSFCSLQRDGFKANWEEAKKEIERLKDIDRSKVTSPSSQPVSPIGMDLTSPLRRLGALNEPARLPDSTSRLGSLKAQTAVPTTGAARFGAAPSSTRPGATTGPSRFAGGVPSSNVRPGSALGGISRLSGGTGISRLGAATGTSTQGTSARLNR